MSKRIAMAGLFVLVAAVSPRGEARADEEIVQPDRSIVGHVQELVALQDALLTGEESAIADYRKVKVSVGRKILASPDAVFKEPANMIAAVRYLLMGGIPHVGRKAILAAKVEGETAPAVGRRHSLFSRAKRSSKSPVCKT